MFQKTYLTRWARWATWARPLPASSAGPPTCPAGHPAPLRTSRLLAVAEVFGPGPRIVRLAS